ncbi:cytochrome c biogenesis protein DipZ, partial [Rhizobium sp. SIMBA_035]
YATWNAYTNQYWPAFYLIDKKGQVVYSHFGEGDYAQTEAAIQKLLAQKE